MRYLLFLFFPVLLSGQNIGADIIFNQPVIVDYQASLGFRVYETYQNFEYSLTYLQNKNTSEETPGKVFKSAFLSASYSLNTGKFYIKPQIGFGLTELDPFDAPVGLSVATPYNRMKVEAGVMYFPVNKIPSIQIKWGLRL